MFTKELCDLLILVFWILILCLHILDIIFNGVAGDCKHAGAKHRCYSLPRQNHLRSTPVSTRDKHAVRDGTRNQIFVTKPFNPSTALHFPAPIRHVTFQVGQYGRTTYGSITIRLIKDQLYNKITLVSPESHVTRTLYCWLAPLQWQRVPLLANRQTLVSYLTPPSISSKVNIKSTTVDRSTTVTMCSPQVDWSYVEPTILPIKY